jgi:hypothetical protein
MKIFIYCLLTICLLTFFFSCIHTKKPHLQIVDECLTEKQDSFFEKQLYPFIESEYQTSNMLKYFNQDVKIDSGYNNKSNGDTVLFYKFYDANSQFIFSLDHYCIRRKDYEIAVFQISSGLIKLKNGIVFGMPKKDLFDAIGYKEVNCDTFDIINYYNGYYFRFIFQEDILKSISKEIIEM